MKRRAPSRVISTAIITVFILAFLAIPQHTAHAASWSVGISQACTNGFRAAAGAFFDNAGDNATFSVTGSTPSGSTGVILSATATSTTQSFTGTFTGAWNTPQSVGTLISVTMVFSGSPAFFNGSFTGSAFVQNCTVSLPAPPSFDPGDGRIDPHASDMLAVWCNTGANPPNLDVWGVLDSTHVVRLFKFDFADIKAAGAAGVSQNLGYNGIVSVGLYNATLFGVSWIGGPHNGNGQGIFRKTFNCDFPSSGANTQQSSSSNSNTPTCAKTYIVKPGDNLYRIALANGTTVATLMALNHISNPSLIYVGQVICLP